MTKDCADVAEEAVEKSKDDTKSESSGSNCHYFYCMY